MLTALLKRSFTLSASARVSTLALVLGIGLAVVPGPFNQMSPAVAEEGGVTDIYTTSDSTVADVPQPAVNANSGSCEKDLPNNPIVDCGYASFGAAVGVPEMGGVRLTTGLPQAIWVDDFGQPHPHNYNGQGQDEFRNVYDPTQDPAVGATHRASNGANAQYYAIGIWWKDKKIWKKESETVRTGTVSNPRYTFETRTQERTINIPTAPFVLTVEESYPVRILNDPITVTVLKVYDQINNAYSENTARLGPGQSVNTYETRIYPVYVNRQIDWGGPNFPRTPRIYTNECAAYVGPGYMTGPYGNDATNPWPVPTGVGTFDPQTELKKWNTRPANAESNPYWIEDSEGGKLYSDAGMLYRSWQWAFFNAQRYPHISLGYDGAKSSIISAIDNCPDIVYQVSAQDQDCVYLGSTFGADYNRTFSSNSDYCSNFTPGNYFKKAKGYTATCQLAEVFWDPDPYDSFGMDLRFSNPFGGPIYEKVFLGCDDEPGENPSAAVNDWVHFICDDPTGDFNRHETYNFANCSGPQNADGSGPVDVADEYRCVAPNGGQPEIIDVESGNVSGPESQMLANGKQVQVRWPAPEGIAVLSDGVLSRVQDPDNPWMNWDAVTGSEPINDSLALDDPNQKIFGSWRENVSPDSTNSDLGGPGKDEWDTPWLYLRAYQGAPVNNEGSSVSVGDVTVGPEETLPLGVTTTFNATVKRTVETGLGGTLEINVPVICSMPDAYLYIVSGRAVD